jgi:hypothetical protein
MSEIPSKAEVLSKLTMAERWALEDPIDFDVATLRRARNHPPCPTCGNDEYWAGHGTMLVCLHCALHNALPWFHRDDSGRNLLSAEEAEAKLERIHGEPMTASEKHETRLAYADRLAPYFNSSPAST